MKYQSKKAIESMIKALDRFLKARAKIHPDDEDKFCDHTIEGSYFVWRDVLIKRDGLEDLLENH